MNQQPITSEILDRLPPQDLDAERRVLYGMSVKAELIDAVAGILREEDFYSDAHQRLFRALVAIYAANRKVDPASLRRQLVEDGSLEAVGGVSYIAEVLSVQTAKVEATINHAETVLECSRRRAMIHAAVDLLREAWDQCESTTQLLEAAEASLGRIRTRAPTENLVDAPTAAMEFLDQVDRIMESGDHCGLFTGLEKFDDAFGGLKPGEYIILAADSSAGKTSLAAQICDHNAARGRLVYVASLEMEAVELTQRLVCAISAVNSRIIRTGKIGPEDRMKLAEGANAFAGRAIRIDPRTDLKVADIRRAARRLLREGLALVAVDYIGLVEPDDYKASREQQVARISRGLKNLAKELKVPVLALCQLNRMHETSERPVLKNLRESGAIGNDAHMVLFLHKPADGIVDTEYEETTGDDGRTHRKKVTIKREWPAELIVAKNRNGETGTIRLDWEAKYTRFSCWDIAQNAENYESAFGQYEGTDGF